MAQHDATLTTRQASVVRSHNAAHGSRNQREVRVTGRP
ncbi:protein of unknown function [Pseudomonas marincola]|uniref:Uncharacterized protein n=1 Tax=Pseudomonas marincola TaxID=437900 RepID=A0A8S2BD95_9PSED|nr:protein of unknown function [Pseudomonas marincola]